MSSEPVPVPADQGSPLPTPTPPMETGRPEAGSLAARGRTEIRIAPIPATPPPQAPPPTPLIDRKPEQQQNEPPRPEQFVFGGYEFESQEAAEHAFKSQDGRVRALSLKLQEYQNALEQARQAGSLGAPPLQPPAYPTPAPLQAQPGQPPVPAAPAPEGESPWFENDALWERYKQLSVEHGPDYAGYLLARQMWENTQRLIQETLDKRVGPIEITAKVAHQYNDTMGLLNEMATKADDAGAPVYPELSSTDPQVLQEVVGLWKEMGGPRAGPRAWHMAVLEYRFRHGPPALGQPPASLNGQQGAPAIGGAAPATVAFGGHVPSPGPFPLAGGTGTPRGDTSPVSPQDALFRGMTGAVLERRTPDGQSLGVFRR